jgi:hypothetical protein
VTAWSRADGRDAATRPNKSVSCVVDIGVPGVISGKFAVRRMAPLSLSVTRHDYI